VPDEEERWASFPYDRRYQISTRGRVIGAKGRLLSCFPRDGYPSFGIRENASYARMWPVHMAVLLTFVGPVPENMECAHENGDRGDPRLSNLSYRTPRANTHQKWDHGTMLEGERQHMAKLTIAKVQRMRELFVSGVPCKALAIQFEVSESTAYEAIHTAWWSAGPPLSGKRRVRSERWRSRDKVRHVRKLKVLEGA
jgi:HNH endonuclease